MSRSGSPTVAATVPSSVPSSATTRHPRSIRNQETGSATSSDGSAADVPDRPLRVDRLRVREHAKDPELAGDAVGVEPLETAARHLGGGAVSEPSRGAEPEGRAPGEPR